VSKGAMQDKSCWLVISVRTSLKQKVLSHYSIYVLTELLSLFQTEVMRENMKEVEINKSKLKPGESLEQY